MNSLVENISWRSLRLGGSISVLLVATVLSVLALHYERRWHPDEAFYMTIARNAAVQGDWMLISEPLDKPPLTYYINALSLKFLAVDSDANGVLFLNVYKGEFAGRIPSLLMSIVLVAAVMSLIHNLTHDVYSALVGGLLMALSPLRIVFAPTAFTDMPMLLFASLSLLLAVRHKWTWASICFMFSFAAKPQSIFCLPLLILLPLSIDVQGTSHQEWRGGRGVRFLLPVLIGILILWAWDTARVNMGATSFWALGQAYYTPTTLTPLADYLARIRELWSTVQYLFGHGSITALLLLIAAFRTIRQPTAVSLILLAWLAGFITLHIVFTLNLFDRNLLLIVPVACVLVAISAGGRQEYHPYIIFIHLLLLLTISVFGVISAMGIYPIGGDDGRHDGIDELAAYLNHKPVATVIYDRWLDWELDYYMGEWMNKRRVYYPTPQQLVEGALELKETGVRYFVAPTTQNVADWLEALTDSGFTVTLDYESDNFRVYALNPP